MFSVSLSPFPYSYIFVDQSNNASVSWMWDITFYNSLGAVVKKYYSNDSTTTGVYYSLATAIEHFLITYVKPTFTNSFLSNKSTFTLIEDVTYSNPTNLSGVVKNGITLGKYIGQTTINLPQNNLMGGFGLGDRVGLYSGYIEFLTVYDFTNVSLLMNYTVYKYTNMEVITIGYKKIESFNWDFSFGAWNIETIGFQQWVTVFRNVDNRIQTTCCLEALCNPNDYILI